MSRPERPQLSSSFPLFGGKTKAVPLAATLLMHAAAIAAFVFMPFDPPARASAVSLTVALMPNHPAEDVSAKSAAARPPVNAVPVAAPKSGGMKGLAIPATRANLPEPSMVSASAPSSTAAAASLMAYAGSSAGQPKTGVSIPAHYAAGNSKPAYPLLARRLEEQGTVVLRILVREDGRAGRVLIRQSSGHELLDESARSAVETWRFQPATVGNVSVAEWYQVAIPFTLYN